MIKKTIIITTFISITLTLTSCEKKISKGDNNENISGKIAIPTDIESAVKTQGDIVITQGCNNITFKDNKGVIIYTQSTAKIDSSLNTAEKLKMITPKQRKTIDELIEKKLKENNCLNKRK